MRKLIILLLLVIPFYAVSQEKAFHSFLRLSCAEKKWAIVHPFVAMRAWKLTVRCRFVTDSLGRVGNPDRDPSGGKLDAFRHSFWMATLTEKIGVRKSLSLGRAHERGDFRNFKRNRFEEGDIPDKAATNMDLFNNVVGSGIGVSLKGKNEQSVVDSVLKAIANGSMRIICKDTLGRSCDLLGTPIPEKDMHGKWITPRELVPSNYSYISAHKK
ncbi:MAG: hypothetical protein Q8904_12135 [Bacteroidota bacterium]|nr:hypothetical protein [Bacteroidota bacterium]